MQKEYPCEVSDRVPAMLQSLCFAWTIILIVAVFLLPGYPQPQYHDEFEPFDEEEK